MLSDINFFLKKCNSFYLSFSAKTKNQALSCLIDLLIWFYNMNACFYIIYIINICADVTKMKEK